MLSELIVQWLIVGSSKLLFAGRKSLGSSSEWARKAAIESSCASEYQWGGM